MSDFGFKIGVDGEKEFKQSIRDINSSMKVLGSEMKLVSAQFDANDRSQAALSARSSVLARSVDEQKGKVDALQSALKNASDSFGENDRRTQQWQIQLNNAQAELVKLERELDANEKALQEVAGEMTDAGQAADRMGDEVRRAGNDTDKAADQMNAAGKKADAFSKTLVTSVAAIGAAAVAAGSALAGLTMDTAAFADEVIATAAQTGISAEKIQEYTYAAELVDVSVDTITKSMAKQIKSMSAATNVTGEAAVDTAKLAKAQNAAANAALTVESAQIKYNEAVAKSGEGSAAAQQAAISLQKAQNGLAQANAEVEAASQAVEPKINATTEAYNKLGVSVFDTAGNMRDGQTVFWEVIDALGKMDNETERDALAMQLLGKSAQDLNPLIKVGAERMAELGKEAHTVGYVMNDETLSSFGKLDDATQQLKLQLGVCKNEIAKQFLPALSDLGGNAKTALADITEALKKPNGPAKKLAEAMKDIINFVLRLASVILPPLINVLAIVADNLGVLLTVAIATVVGLKTFSIVQKITNYITVMGGAIKAVTAAQLAWNAAIASNPIGLIASVISVGIVACISLVWAFIEAEKNMKSSMELLTEAEKENTQAAKDNAQAYQEMKDKQAEAAAGELSHLSNIERLSDELDRLTDANGRVKESNKARVEFILGELNSALDAEYTMTGNVVNNYRELKTAIEDAIAAKKAQILLQAQEATYSEALTNYIALQDAQAQKSLEIAEAQKEVNNLLDFYNEAMANPRPGDSATGANEKRNLEEAQDRLAQMKSTYNENETLLKSYYADISGYENASEMLLSGNTEAAISMLENMNNVFYRASELADKSLEEQKRILKEQLDVTEENARLMAERYKAGVDGVTIEMVTQAEELADKAYDEYALVGGCIPRAMADGISGGASGVRKEMRDAYRSGLNAVEEELPSIEEIGRQMANGMRTGVNDRIPSFRETMRRIIREGITAAKNEAEIKSPSRKTRKELGVNLGLGAALGVEDSTKSVVTAVAKQMRAVRDAYKRNSGFDIGISATADALQMGLYSAARTPAFAFAGTRGNSSVVNVYPQQLTEAQVDYLVTRINRELGNSM